ncbi:MAG: PQQ-binding-like beta-propeller repeat protein [Bacteroidia bacterium]|nr:PQQ-binding-like beta-propeller repeat protein [Bacteroidia bacterium]
MNHKISFGRINPGIFLGFVLLLASCSNNNWPQFRGPENKMVAVNTNLPDDWGMSKNIRWTYDLSGTGWSSPVVWGNKIFIASAFAEKKTPEKPEEPESQEPEKEDTSYRNDIYRWEVTCIDLKTGKKLWEQVARKGNPRTGAQSGNTYASETPVTDGKRIYVYFGMTGVYCYDFNGNLIWQKDLGAYPTLNSWGTGSSPVIYKDLLFIQIDNEESSFLVALNAANGEEKWRAVRQEKTNYSTPVIWKNKIRNELVTAGKTARSYDPATGKLLWQLNMGGEMSISSPAADKEHLYIGIGRGEEVKGNFFAVKAGAEGDITPAEGQRISKGVLWSQPAAEVGSTSPLLYNGLIYFLGGRGGKMACYDAATGDSVYRAKADSMAGCWASPWANNDKIFITDEKGTTHVIKAGKKFEVLSKNKLNDKIWSSVAITKDAYILKGVKGLYCIGK